MKGVPTLHGWPEQGRSGQLEVSLDGLDHRRVFLPGQQCQHGGTNNVFRVTPERLRYRGLLE